jgi:hypothetical protein
MYSRRLASWSRALAFVVVGARAMAFLGLGVGVACVDMKDKELTLEEIAVSLSYTRSTVTNARHVRMEGGKIKNGEPAALLNGT